MSTYLADYLKISTRSVSANWCNYRQIPRSGGVQPLLYNLHILYILCRSAKLQFKTNLSRRTMATQI